MPRRAATASMAGTTHILRASLRPKLYRDIEIESTDPLHSLAEAITRAFGFDFDHAFGFFSRLTGRVFASPIRYDCLPTMRSAVHRAACETQRSATLFPGLEARCCSCSTTATNGVSASRWSVVARQQRARPILGSLQASARLRSSIPTPRRADPPCQRLGPPATDAEPTTGACS